MNEECFVAKIEIVSSNVIKSSCSGNKFKIANQDSFIHTNYLKISFNTNILSIKYMNSMTVSDVRFWQKMCTSM